MDITVKLTNSQLTYFWSVVGLHNESTTDTALHIAPLAPNSWLRIHGRQVIINRHQCPLRMVEVLTLLGKAVSPKARALWDEADKSSGKDANRLYYLAMQTAQAEFPTLGVIQRIWTSVK